MANPGPMPTQLPDADTCAPSTAFGIPASALPTAGGKHGDCDAGRHADQAGQHADQDDVRQGEPDRDGADHACDGRVSSMTMPSPALGSQPPEEAPARRRSTELWMMLFACGIVVFAFLNMAGSLKDQHLSTVFEYMIAFLVIVLGAHLAIRLWAPYADPLLLPIATVLNGLGIVMIYRLNQVGRDGNPGNGGPITTLSHSATITQIIYSVLGVVVFVLFLRFIKDIKVLQPYTYVLGLAGLVLIALPALLPSSISGVAGTGAKIQVSIGGFSFQPEEFGKLLLAASFASYLVINGKKLSLLTEKWWIFSLPRRRDLGPDPGGLGAQHAAADLRGRHRHQRGVHGPVRGDALHRDRAQVVGGPRLPDVHRRRLPRGRARAARAASGSPSGSTRSAPRTSSSSPSPPTSSCRACTGWATAACSARGSAAASRSGPRSCRAT